MPITYIFNKTTGAGGTPTACGPDLSNLPWNVVDLTDPVWTLLDPDSLVDTNTYTTGYNNVVMNVLGAGSTDYAFGTSNVLRAPRWYIPLVAQDAYGNDVRITTEDTFVMSFKMTKGTTTSEWDTELVVAACAVPTSLVSITVDGIGGMTDYVTASDTGYGIYTVNAKSVTTGPTNDVGITSTLTAGRRGQGGTYIALDGAGAQIAGGTRNAGNLYVAATDMFLMVGVGTIAAATIAAGDDTDFKFEYRVIKFA